MSALGVADGPAFLRLMKRYVMDYSNSHDQAETAAIMEPDYTLQMGDHRVVGRDAQYFAATRKQMDQFPGLVLTVHEIWTSGERLMMRFSEHGASARHGGALAAWAGIGLYAWNGTRLVGNFVEQDYASRAAQLDGGSPNAVEGPAIAPWDGTAQAPDPASEAIVSDWLQAGGLLTSPEVLCDDEWTGAAKNPPLEQTAVAINSLFSCGQHVAFHATQHGRVRPEFAADAAGAAARMSMAGIVHLVDDLVAHGRVVRNRLDLQRSLAPRSR